MSDRVAIVMLGHVDHGKSTLVGRLLAETGNVPIGKIDLLRTSCRKRGLAFEYAFLLDTFREEQVQGITIDTTRIFFTLGEHNERQFILNDVPGHSEFLKNMVTGAARADAALLVVDAKEGIQENSKKHVRLASYIGVKETLVVVNKMDLVGYSRERFEGIRMQILELLGQKVKVLPVSALQGENFISRSPNMTWFEGPTLLQCLEQIPPTLVERSLPSRFPIQTVLRENERGINKRLILGTLVSGQLKVGDSILLLPSKQSSGIKSIEVFQKQKETAVAGEAIALTLTDEIYLKRGEVVCRQEDQVCLVSRRLGVNLFWLGKEPAVIGREYLIKLGTSKTRAVFEVLESVSEGDFFNGVLKLDESIAVDLASNGSKLSRFVLVERNQIVGGGSVLEVKEETLSEVEKKMVVLQDSHWEYSLVTHEERRDRYQQNPLVLLVTGSQGLRNPIGKLLEKALFDQGRSTVYLERLSLLHGLDSDPGRDVMGDVMDRTEHLRRFGEVAHLLWKTGLIVVGTAQPLTCNEMILLKEIIGKENLISVWLGEGAPSYIDIPIHSDSKGTVIEAILSTLQRQNIL